MEAFSSHLLWNINRETNIIKGKLKKNFFEYKKKNKKNEKTTQ